MTMLQDMGLDSRNRDVLGLYVMTRDSGCWLLSADFGNDGWQGVHGEGATGDHICSTRSCWRRRSLGRAL